MVPKRMPDADADAFLRLYLPACTSEFCVREKRFCVDFFGGGFSRFSNFLLARKSDPASRSIQTSASKRKQQAFIPFHQTNGPTIPCQRRNQELHSRYYRLESNILSECLEDIGTINLSAGNFN
jgi:hypothetical protein